MDIHAAYKREGETPLQCLERVRIEKNISPKTKLTYLGRLDPMAEGLLLIGEEVDQREREKLLSLRKTYVVEVLFEFATDTYDILGKVTNAPTRDTHRRINMLRVMEALSKIPGTFEQPYPPYSSKPAVDTSGDKRPLFALSRDGLVPEEIPARVVEVYACTLDKMTSVQGDALLQDIHERIKKVSGDFRQKEIGECWDRALGPLYDQSFDIATITLEVSSGTYARSIAHNLGAALGTSALALRILRTRLGKYGENDKK